MGRQTIEGVRVGGRQPKALLLSDGTRLALEEEGPGGQPRWVRIGEEGPDAALSVEQALALAGAGHGDYVVTRTRAEVEWLRLVAEWFAQQAERLDTDLDRAVATGD
jgi:hypothetical protein